MPASPAAEAARRRTFAIISHPDAGKTTLTEHLLLAGGAIRAAGAVRARGEQRRTTSDWMKIERERGISVSASVMTFDHDGLMFNLLDTPGHEDFSEDTYRTLTAANAAVMVAAGGLLMLGRAPRLSALALAGSLIPTTLAGHSYWEHEDEATRKVQRIQFHKNLAMIGGLIFAALDEPRTPSE